jgi:hypothetical protein
MNPMMIVHKMLMLSLLRGKSGNAGVDWKQRGPRACWMQKKKVRDHCKIVRITSSLIYVNDPSACTEAVGA